MCFCEDFTNLTALCYLQQRDTDGLVMIWPAECLKAVMGIVGVMAQSTTEKNVPKSTTLPPFLWKAFS